MSADSDKLIWLSKQSKGAAAELLAAGWALARGLHVYRAQSPAAPFDLVLVEPVSHRLIRVEVKSIYRHSPAIYCPNFSWPVNDDWDWLLVVDVDHDGRVFRFDHGQSADECRNIVRAHFGYATLAESAYLPNGGRLI